MATQKLRALDPLLHLETEDLLHKESEFLEPFYQLIDDAVEPPFAISIDGLWGTGKTTVMKLLEAKFRDRQYPVFWFNPWKYSQNSDVVLAFLQALVNDKNYRPVYEQIKDSSGKIFQVVMHIGLNTALKFVTQGAISLGDVKEQFKDVELPFETYQDMVVKLEDAFRDLVNAISKDRGKPLIIFLDDFDRCLPQDAIKLLEALKNLFVTRGCRVIFICGIDTRVAKNFIRDHYKVTDDFAVNYFRKIFNLTVSMPYSANIKDLLLSHIKELYGWDAPDNQHAELVAQRLTNLGRQAEIVSVRKYLNILHNFLAFQRFNPDYHFEPEQDIVLYLLFVKEAWQPLYETIVRHSISSDHPTLKEVIERVKHDFSHAQQTILFKYFTDNPSFSQQKLGELIKRYPTLA